MTMTTPTMRRCGRIDPALLRAPIMVATAMLPAAAANVDPGGGPTAIGTTGARVAAAKLTAIGFVWYPRSRVLRNRHTRSEPASAAAAATAKPEGSQ